MGYDHELSFIINGVSSSGLFIHQKTAISTERKLRSVQADLFIV